MDHIDLCKTLLCTQEFLFVLYVLLILFKKKYLGIPLLHPGIYNH